RQAHRAPEALAQSAAFPASTALDSQRRPRNQGQCAAVRARVGSAESATKCFFFLDPVNGAASGLPEPSWACLPVSVVSRSARTFVPTYPRLHPQLRRWPVPREPAPARVLARRGVLGLRPGSRALLPCFPES